MGFNNYCWSSYSMWSTFSGYHLDFVKNYVIQIMYTCTFKVTVLHKICGKTGLKKLIKGTNIYN